MIHVQKIYCQRSTTNRYLFFFRRAALNASLLSLLHTSLLSTRRAPPVERRCAQHFDSFGLCRLSSGRGSHFLCFMYADIGKPKSPELRKGIVASSASSARRRSPDADGRTPELSYFPAGSDIATFSSTGSGHSPLVIDGNPRRSPRCCNAAAALLTGGIGAARLYSVIGVGGNRPPHPVNRTPVRQLSGQSTKLKFIVSHVRQCVGTVNIWP
jgi:hypothetical protein